MICYPVISYTNCAFRLRLFYVPIRRVEIGHRGYWSVGDKFSITVINEKFALQNQGWKFLKFKKKYLLLFEVVVIFLNKKYLVIHSFSFYEKRFVSSLIIFIVIFGKKNKSVNLKMWFKYSPFCSYKWNCDFCISKTNLCHKN